MPSWGKVSPRENPPPHFQGSSVRLFSGLGTSMSKATIPDFGTGDKILKLNIFVHHFCAHTRKQPTTPAVYFLYATFFDQNTGNI